MERKIIFDGYLPVRRVIKRDVHFAAMIGDMIDGLSQLDTFMRQHENFLQAYDQLIRAVAHLPTNAESHDHIYIELEEKRRQAIDGSVSATATEALVRIQKAHDKTSAA